MSLRKRVLVAAALVGLMPMSVSAEETPPARKLKVANPAGYFSDAAIQDLVYETISPETREHLLTSNDAVWVFTAKHSLQNGSNYCWAKVGLTEAAPAGRSARVPASEYAGANHSNTRGPMSDEQIKDCMSSALRTAIQSFAKAGLKDQLDDIERTRSKGKRAFKPASPTTAHLFSQVLSQAGKDAIFEAIPSGFSAAFDYRRLEWVTLTNAFRFDKQVVCFGFAGVSAHPPDERWPRLPGSWTSTIWEMTPAESSDTDAEQKCRDDVALSGVKSRLETSWDDKGLLEDFKLTREDGLQLVNGYKPKRPTRRAMPRPSAKPYMSAATATAAWSSK